MSLYFPAPVLLSASFSSMPGSRGAFHRVYEQPIVMGKEPSATAVEKEIAEKRADEVHTIIC